MQPLTGDYMPQRVRLHQTAAAAKRLADNKDHNTCDVIIQDLCIGTRTRTLH